MGSEGMRNKEIDEDGIQWTKSVCFFCGSNCAIKVGVKDGKIVKMAPNEERYTVLCERIGDNGERAIKFHYHPQRINYALKRAGERGEDKWVKIPYEQALDEIAEKLQKLKDEYGPETLAVAEGTYRSGHLWARARFSNLFGNPSNLADPGTVCWCWIYSVNLAVCGFQVELGMSPTITHSDCIVMWGVRADERYAPKGPIWRTIQYTMERPDKRPRIIVIDPVATESVRHADLWLQVRPGTDLALMLGWCNVIINEKLHQEDFLRDWSNGSFLVSMDTGMLLREADIVEGGNRENFVAWDENSRKPVVWLSKENRYKEENVSNALEGDYEVTLAGGEKVWCRTGFTLLSERIAEYTPEIVEQVTSVPARKIQEAARMYATTRPGTIMWGLGGGDQHGWNATYSALAKTLLRVLTGNLDVKGGDYVGEPGPILKNGKMPVRDSELELSEVVSPEAREKLLGNDRFKMMSWKGFELMDKNYRAMWGIPRPQQHQLISTAPLVWRAILNSDPYPVRAMIVWSGNPMAWAPNTKLVYKALKSLNLLVVVDYWKTPTAALADYIMPAADWMERPVCTTVEDALDVFVGGDRAVQPEADRRVDYDFFRGLGIRLGQADYWPWETYEDCIAHRMERVEVTYEEFVEKGALIGKMRTEKHKEILPNGQVRGFATPSRRVEIYSSIFEELEYSPLPFYRELPETPFSNPELAAQYPLILITGGRFVPMHHSEHRVIGTGTREMWPWPTFQIHAQTARDLGIRDGDWCWIETPRGRIRQRAKIGWSIAPGTIIAQASWWYPEMPAEEPFSSGAFESNVNVLTDDDPDTLDPMCGNWVNRGLLCRVYRCPKPEGLTVEKVPIEAFHNGESGYWGG